MGTGEGRSSGVHVSRLRVVFGALAAGAAGSLLVTAGAQAGVKSSFVQAHRGGTIETVKGKPKPAYGEETMPAFKAAAAEGFVLELDVKLSADGVPMAIHDDTLDRTTGCEGLVAERTAAEIRRACPVDVLGTGDVTKRLGPRSRKLEPVPTLAKVLKFANRKRAQLNVEVKNVPTDDDFDPGTTYAQTVADTIRESGFPPRRLIVQSFLPTNLDVFASDPYFDDAETSYLTLQNLTNESGPAFAGTAGYDWVSPEWPVDQAYVDEAHGLGLRVVPFTLNRRADVKAATRFGVDALITDDPLTARRAAERADR